MCVVPRPEARTFVFSADWAGLRIFRGKGNCTACHVGPTFSDERTHNTGVAWRHDGSLGTLEAVVRFYDEGGRANPNLDPEIRPLRLTTPEQCALVSFVGSLSGTIRDGLGR